MANQYEINNKAEQIAGLLDQGDDNWAANLLRQEAQQMGPNDFRALVTRTNRFDNDQIGANLVIYDGGVHVSGNNGDQYIAQLDDGASSRRNRIHVDNNVPAGCYYQDVPVYSRNNGGTGEAVVGAVVGALQSGNMQGALYGMQRGLLNGGQAVQYERRLLCPEQVAQPYYQQQQQIYQQPIYHRYGGYLKR
jgi:hypothetical protein